MLHPADEPETAVQGCLFSFGHTYAHVHNMYRPSGQFLLLSLQVIFKHLPVTTTQASKN